LCDDSVRLVGSYGFGQVAFFFDDHDLGSAFKRVYQLEERQVGQAIGSFMLSRYSSDIFSLKSTFGHDEIGSLARVLGLIDTFLEASIRAKADARTCSPHASSCVIDNIAISCIGLSGTGKTTLSLLLAREGCGKYLGDEYAFLDLVTGKIHHEKHPIQIKNTTSYFKPNQVSLPILSSYGLLSNTYIPEDFNLESAEGEFDLGIMVFPCYCRNGHSTNIEKVSISSLSNLIMPSVVGGSDRAALFRSLIQIIAKRDIRLYCVRYSDAKDAAQKILVEAKADHVWGQYEQQ
jgi:hypothetical protein